MGVVLAIKNMDKVLELLAWFQERSDRNALLFRLGINTALRIGDILKIQYKDIFNGGGEFREYLQLNETKTGKERKRKLNDQIRPHILKYCKFYRMEGDDYLFFSVQDPSKHIHRTTAWRLLKAGAEACGMEHIGTQSLRKTCGRHVYYSSKKNIALTMALLNHSKPKETLIYIGEDQADVDAALMEFGI